MSQISPPVRIVAVAAVALIVVYMAFLRPKSSSTAPAAPAATPTGNIHTGKPAVTSFGKAVQAAQGAAKAEENQAKANAGESGSASSSTTGSSSASGSATKSDSTSAPAAKPAAPAVDVAGLPRPVAHAIRRHEVLALLFWNGRSADDRAVHSELRHIETFHGAVYVHTAPIGQIARYGRITRGADVEQSPTLVVVDRKLQATNLVGYVDQDTIQQAVVDAMRASGGIFVNDSYLRSVNRMCSSVAHDFYAMPQPTSIPQARHWVNRRMVRLDTFKADLRGQAAPRKWRSFKQATLADLGVMTGAYHSLAGDLRGHPALNTVLSKFDAADNAIGPAGERFNKRMDRTGLIYCGAQG